MNTNKSRLFEGKKATGGGTGGDATDIAFNGKRPISRQTPGMQGVNPNTETVIDFLEKVFYPAIAPDASLSVDNPVREIGQDDSYTLTWAVTKHSHPITGITVDGNVEAPTGDDQSGTEAGSLGATTGSFTKNMLVTDGSLSSTASATVVYLPRVFWGTTSKDGDSSPILDSDILGLTGSQLRTDFQLTLLNFGGGNTRLLFAFPSGFGTPQFKVNGLNNTAFTLVRENSPFVNSQGATINMDVWVSNNLYNSPLDSVILS